MKMLCTVALLALTISAAQAQPNLTLRADLPDGAKWILGDSGIGRPFKVRLLLVNQGNMARSH